METTTLRMFYARAFTLVAFVLLLLVLFTGLAFAQDAITVDQLAAPAEDYTGIAGLANSVLTGIASALAGLVVAIVARLWNQIPVAVRALIEKVQTTDSKEWRENLREAAYDALVYATIQLKIDPKAIQSWEEKHAFLKLAGEFIERFDPEIKSAIDKDKNGIPDIIDIALAKIAPQTALIAPPAQSFMAPPSIVEPRRMVKARASDEVVERLAAKFATVKRPKGAVTQ